MSKLNGKKFVCPECGGNELNESQSGIVAYTYVEEVTVSADGDCDFKYEYETEYEGGDDVRYCCPSCDQEFTRKDFAAMAAGLPLPDEEEEDDEEDE
jgi:predicted RNA-binding Zn-ribbon protein involved in translation (DUF1610 family)